MEVHGYVIVEDMFSQDECGMLKSELYRLRDERLAYGDEAHPQGLRFAQNDPHHHFICHLLEASPIAAAYATHPRMVAMAEELIGGEARIVECNAHINSRPPGLGPCDFPKDGFHTGSDVPFATHEKNGLTHFTFVKTLTNLTDLGPDHGGTLVIPGSHKSNLPKGEIIEAALADHSLITQVEAPAGSTLLFSETLIHSGQPVRSERERVVIISGYASRLFPYWDMGPPYDGPPFSEEFAAGIPENMRTLFLGRPHWGRNMRYRQLSEPADLRQFDLGVWNERE
jgi:ectoine hydroxylase-related dioxygenase (phytanoyl-CoA dioxygenase family)